MKDSTVLVVYYSRSRNTEAMARKVARKFNADIVKIEAESTREDGSGYCQRTGGLNLKCIELFGGKHDSPVKSPFYGQLRI